MWCCNLERSDCHLIAETGAGRDIQKVRKHRLSLPMHEHACFDAPWRSGKYIWQSVQNIWIKKTDGFDCYQSTSSVTVWNFFCKFRSSMIIDVAWRQFSAVKPYLFNSKNKLVCQEHPENLGVYLLLIFQLLLLYLHPVRVHDFQLTTNFSPVSDWHCPLFGNLESPQI